MQEYPTVEFYYQYTFVLVFNLPIVRDEQFTNITYSFPRTNGHVKLLAVGMNA